MQNGEVVNLFDANRGKSPQAIKRSEPVAPLHRRVWQRIAAIATAVADVAREARELEIRLLDQGGHRRFRNG